MIRVEPELSHLADPDSVEQNRGAGQEARHGILEADAINRPLAETSRVVEPMDKAKNGSYGSEHKQSDQGVRGACFHCSAVSVGAEAARERLPRK